MLNQLYLLINEKRERCQPSSNNLKDVSVETMADERPRSVKMRNDEGTIRMTPRRRVGGYCSVERPEISRERSPEESISRLDNQRDRDRIARAETRGPRLNERAPFAR
ncbi:hypothetical protein ALC57_16343 [Trachymyrmex cornetzi]|uniref:Uncharacterized protein n=1 Tax=Trachymyrmex cornetzi TaxID=471704 RepID=A0A195DGG7_9HYME|nr:hypothetical protein ALC57_16343 [Trachymyrmex cornetzi]